VALAAVWLGQMLAPPCAQGARLPGTGLNEGAARVYRIHVPDCGPKAKFAMRLAYLPEPTRPDREAGWLQPAAPVRLGGWEVTVVFDPVHCDLYCTYRRKPGTARLLPPLAAIQIYASPMAKPRTVTVDPAGLSNPSAARSLPVAAERACLPGKKLYLSIWGLRAKPVHGAAPVPRLSAGPHLETAPEAVAPLRI